MNYDSPGQISRYLGERGLSLKKRFGQNFLVSPGARRKIISLLDPEAGQTVWEIGAGIGSMTHLLVEAEVQVVAFEIDYGLVRVLETTLGRRKNLSIISGDYLKTWREAAGIQGLPDLLVGNLPYRAAATIISSLVGWDAPVKRAVFTVQREVGQRMAATPGTKDYSGFSMICQSVFSVRRAGDIAAASFYPVPEVTSSIVVLTANPLPDSYDRDLYHEVVHDLFAARRKTVRNNLFAGKVGANFGPEATDRALRAADIDPGARGEQLSVERVVELVRALESGRASRRS